MNRRKRHLFISGYAINVQTSCSIFDPICLALSSRGRLRHLLSGVHRTPRRRDSPTMQHRKNILSPLALMTHLPTAPDKDIRAQITSIAQIPFMTCVAPAQNHHYDPHQYLHEAIVDLIRPIDQGDGRLVVNRRSMLHVRFWRAL